MDLSLYKEESQLKKRKGKKRKATSPLKIDSKSKSTKKSPTASKVRKVATAAGAAAKVTKPKTKAKLVGRAVARKQQQQGAVVSEKKKAAVAQGRAERAAKRRGPDGGSAAAATRSPVVDQKKAKVLAKVARKSGQKKQAPAKSKCKYFGNFEKFGFGCFATRIFANFNSKLFLKNEQHLNFYNQN